LRDDFSRNADKTRVTWRDAVRLRLVSRATRAAVDTETEFWRKQYELLTADKLYDPPHLVALEEQREYREAFALGLKETARTNVRAAELHWLPFFSRMLETAESEEVRLKRCPWWRYDKPRQHRLRLDGTLDAMTHDPSNPGHYTRIVAGHWTYAFLPAAPSDVFICIILSGKSKHTLWRIQRNERWCVLLVGFGSLKVGPTPITLRGQPRQKGEEQVDEAGLISDEDQQMLLKASIAMDRAHACGRVWRGAPTKTLGPNHASWHAARATVPQDED
jgi:hypothetical protein